MRCRCELRLRLARTQVLPGSSKPSHVALLPGPPFRAILSCVYFWRLCLVQGKRLQQDQASVSACLLGSCEMCWFRCRYWFSLRSGGLPTTAARPRLLRLQSSPVWYVALGRAALVDHPLRKVQRQEIISTPDSIYCALWRRCARRALDLSFPSLSNSRKWEMMTPMLEFSIA